MATARSFYTIVLFKKDRPYELLKDDEVIEQVRRVLPKSFPATKGLLKPDNIYCRIGGIWDHTLCIYNRIVPEKDNQLVEPEMDPDYVYPIQDNFAITPYMLEYIDGRQFTIPFAFPFALAIDTERPEWYQRAKFNPDGSIGPEKSGWREFVTGIFERYRDWWYGVAVDLTIEI